MAKSKKVIAAIPLLAASMVFAGNPEQYNSNLAAAAQAYPDRPLPTLLQLRDCAQRDAALTAQQTQLDAEAEALRAEETELAARERKIQAMRSKGNTKSLMREQNEWKHASAQLKNKMASFDRLFAPYHARVLYQVQNCAFSQVHRQHLQQLCQEGTYPAFCAKYQAFQTED
ncbi:MAG TPA: hypothetical protein VJ654_19335 [Noviherbaspirillum sp.]|nr:hypothetical protein [Noviherbaspirillum sp.]